MKILKINDKFSIDYDDKNNNRPVYVKHHGLHLQNMDDDIPNWVIAMFYALLETEQRHEDANAGNIEINTLLINGEL